MVSNIFIASVTLYFTVTWFNRNKTESKDLKLSIGFFFTLMMYQFGIPVQSSYYNHLSLYHLDYSLKEELAIKFFFINMMVYFN